jgi:hypothetical protein
MVYLPLACTPGKSLEPAFVIRTVPCNDTYLPTYLPMIILSHRSHTRCHHCAARRAFIGFLGTKDQTTLSLSKVRNYRATELTYPICHTFMNLHTRGIRDFSFHSCRYGCCWTLLADTLQDSRLHIIMLRSSYLCGVLNLRTWAVTPLPALCFHIFCILGTYEGIFCTSGPAAAPWLDLLYAWLERIMKIIQDRTRGQSCGTCLPS